MPRILIHTMVCVAVAVGLIGCGKSSGQYAGDIDFLLKHTDTFELTDATGVGRVAVTPEFQARVMTSTYAGSAGRSLGWINPTAILNKHTTAPFHPFGGEERFWIGPEGGQFAFFFHPDDPFDTKHWFVPPLLDTEPFTLVDRQSNYAVFTRSASLKNRAGYTFDMKIDRSISVLEPDRIRVLLGARPGDPLAMVGYETVNTLTNTGRQKWTEQTGMPSIWLLGMFPATPHTTAVLPIRSGGTQKVGPRVVVYDTFNKLSGERLQVRENVIYFKADGRFRSKIGIPPQRAMPVLAGYDAKNNVLTIVQYNLPQGTTHYVKSTWETQKQPFAGDVTNSYNDGNLGFYELESSSPAANLEPGQSIRHVSRTIHLTGPTESLNLIANEVLGVTLDEIKQAFR